MMKSCCIAVLAGICCAVVPLTAQHPDAAGDSARAERAAPERRWESGVTLRSVQVELPFISPVGDMGASADLDFLTNSRYGLGIRGGVYHSESRNLVDYSYETLMWRLLARVSVLDKWVRLDLYGGYALVSFTHGGFELPGSTRIYHTMELGSEARIYLIPPALAILLRYSAAMDRPFGEESQTFETGGIGLAIGWQW